ncbi:GCG_CRPN prefix-to-repeats domain-containing protein [Methylobacterium sp. M6A4_1b]
MSVKSLFRTMLARTTRTAALGVAGAVGLAAAAQATPIAPAGTLAGAAVEAVAYGCGPGFIPNRFGYCRPMYRPYGYDRPRPFYGPRYGYYRPRPHFGPYF